MTHRGARLIRVAIIAALALSSGGCARLFGSYDIAPNGMATSEDRLRQLLRTGQAATALERLDDSAPGDDVLRALYEGLLAYHAGDYAGSARMLDGAGSMADDRITKSVSRSALSLVSNDRALPYEPGRTERLMIPYYAALARSRLGDTEGAAVEARRLSMLLQGYRDDGADLPPPLTATLHLIAGALFEANGERGAAAVAYRNAVALDSTITIDADVDSAGVVFVILEQGFVAHRVEQALAVMVLPEEVYAIAEGSGEDRAAAAGFVAGRILQHAVSDRSYAGEPYRRGGSTLFVPAPEHTPLPRTRKRGVCTAVEPAASATADSASAARAQNAAPRETCVEKEEPIDELPYLLRVAWPVYRSDDRLLQEPRVVVAGDSAPFAASVELSRGVIADFDGERMLIAARTVARGTAKLALTKGAEAKVEEQNEVAGKLVGLLGNLGNVLLERADTRSWHSLPAGVAVARIALPPGDHELTVQIGGRTIALEPITVRRGSVSIVPVRAW